MRSAHDTDGLAGRGRRIALAIVLLASLAPAALVAQDDGADPAGAARIALDTMISAIREGNTPMRDRMFFKLRILGEPSVEPLIATLSNDDARVREYAAFTLSFIDDDRAVDPLLAMFANDAEVTVRTQAARALGRMEEPRAIDPLIAALSDQRSEIRQDAAYSLGLIGDPRAIPPLKALASDSDELVRFFVDDALVRIDRAVKRKAAEKK
ncbi:MAG: HEAT repeat domain-containing protein [bacterium]